MCGNVPAWRYNFIIYLYLVAQVQLHFGLSSTFWYSSSSAAAQTVSPTWSTCFPLTEKCREHFLTTCDMMNNATSLMFKHRCAKYVISAVMLHRVHWWKSGIKIINISNRSLCNYTSPWHSVSASQKNNSCGTPVRHLPCLIEGLINETSCRPFNGDEFPGHRSEAPVFSLWKYNETQMIFFLSGGGELSIHWHRAVGYWILGVLVSIKRLPDREHGGVMNLGVAALPEEAFICVWQAGGRFLPRSALSVIQPWRGRHKGVF